MKLWSGEFSYWQTRLSSNGASVNAGTHPHVGPCCHQLLPADLALHCVGIYDWPSRIVGNLKAAPMISGDTKELSLATIHPRWQVLLLEAQISTRSTKKGELLTSRRNALC